MRLIDEETEVLEMINEPASEIQSKVEERILMAMDDWGSASHELQNKTTRGYSWSKVAKGYGRLEWKCVCKPRTHATAHIDFCRNVAITSMQISTMKTKKLLLGLRDS